MPDVDFVMGCGDPPCAALPSPQRGRRRRLSEGLALTQLPRSDRASGATTRAFGDDGGGVDRGGSKSSQAAPSSQGAQQRLVDDFGTLLPLLSDAVAADDADAAAADATGGGRDDGESNGAARQRQQGPTPGGYAGGRDLQRWGSEAGRLRGRRLAGRKAKPPAWPLPMFSYDTAESHSDIPFPDFSYWGHEQDRLWGESPCRHHASYNTVHVSHFKDTMHTVHRVMLVT